MRSIVFAMALLAVAGCASVSRLSVNRQLAAKPPGCPVEVLTMPPTRAHEEIATLQLEGDFEALTPYIEKIKKEVCALGGDAVLVRQINGNWLDYKTGLATVLHWK